MTQPGQPEPSPRPPATDTPTTNVLAVLALVFALVAGPLAIVFGVVALVQIRRTGQGGKGLATAGIALGGLFTLVGLAVATVVGVRLLLAPPTMERSAVTEAVRTMLNAQGYSNAAGLSCPGDLKGEIGTSVRCRFTVDEQPTDAVVTVTSVRNGRIDYNIVTEAYPVAKALLERNVAQMIGPKFGVTIERAVCTGDLPAVVGGRVNCALTAQSTTNTFEVTTQSVQGGRINYLARPIVR